MATMMHSVNDRLYNDDTQEASNLSRISRMETTLRSLEELSSLILARIDSMSDRMDLMEKNVTNLQQQQNQFQNQLTVIQTKALEAATAPTPTPTLTPSATTSTPPSSSSNLSPSATILQPQPKPAQPPLSKEERIKQQINAQLARPVPVSTSAPAVQQRPSSAGSSPFSSNNTSSSFNSGPSAPFNPSFASPFTSSKPVPSFGSTSSIGSGTMKKTTAYVKKGGRLVSSTTGPKLKPAGVKKSKKGKKKRFGEADGVWPPPPHLRRHAVGDEQQPTDGAWGSKSAMMGRPDANDEYNSGVIRKVKYNMNMITSEANIQEYSTAAAELLKDKVNSAQLLRDIVQVIFDKAIDEPRFAPYFAQFVAIVNPSCPSFDEEGRRITFQRLLLNKCQEQFEKAREPNESGQRNDPRNKQKLISVVSFIGELYKNGMLADNIMHQYVFPKLLSELAEDDLEAFVKLLTILMEVPKAVPHLTQYFEQAQKMSRSSAISGRIQRMMTVLLELWAKKVQQL